MFKFTSTRIFNRAFRVYSPGHRLRSGKQSKLLHVPKYNTRYGKQRFTYAAAIAWNELTDDLRSKDSLLEFRKQLKTHLFKIAFNLG